MQDTWSWFTCTTHTHTCLTALGPGLPGWAGTRKVKPIWITGARDSEWQWHQLGRMQVCTSLQRDNHASTPPLSFFTDRMPFLPPDQQCQSTEGNKWNSVVQQSHKLMQYYFIIRHSSYCPGNTIISLLNINLPMFFNETSICRVDWHHGIYGDNIFAILWV